MAKKVKQYTEAELIKFFGLTRISHSENSLLLQEWLNAQTTLNAGEQYIFDMILTDAKTQIDGWQEEDLKMQFISFVLRLANLSHPEKNYLTFFERTVSATIGEYFLKVKTDCMIAKGILDRPEVPYFHFQEYKRQTNPFGSPIAQVLEAMLIASELNQNNKPIYGCYVIGKFWNFMVLEQKVYTLSKSYDCTERDDLLQIISVLRKFKEILENRLLD
jgi:hypothetical protein